MFFRGIETQFFRRLGVPIVFLASGKTALRMEQNYSRTPAPLRSNNRRPSAELYCAPKVKLMPVLYRRLF